MNEFDAAYQQAGRENFSHRVANHPRTTRFELYPLLELGGGVRLYGFRFPGKHDWPSRAYLTLSEGVTILSQPLNEDWGTSVTNAWGERFIGCLLQLGPLAQGWPLQLYQHYFDKPELDGVYLCPQGRVGWIHLARGAKKVAETWEGLTGEAMPDFAALDWGHNHE